MVAHNIACLFAIGVDAIISGSPTPHTVTNFQSNRAFDGNFVNDYNVGLSVRSGKVNKAESASAGRQKPSSKAAEPPI
jgi:hypothetical protein